MSVLCVCSLNVDVSRGDVVSVLFTPDQQLYAEWIVLPDAITELFDQLSVTVFGTFSGSYPVTLCLA
jgi:hypothetical protein